MKERRYSKPAGTIICNFECEKRLPCPAPIEFKCKQEWLKQQAKDHAPIVTFID